MMRKLKISKIIASLLILTSVVALTPAPANAEWRQDGAGWLYTEGSSLSTGWRQIDGKWYCFYDNGYMITDKDVDGWYINSSGVGTECVKIGEYEIDKSTGTIAKYNGEGAILYPGSISISLDIPRKIGDIEIKHIGGHAFEHCDNSSKITIPDGITSIGESAFGGCARLTNITIPDSVTNIGYGAFWACDKLTTVTIPNRVTSIGGSAFQGCNNLREVTIPNSVTSIEDSAFQDCNKLTTITIPNSVTNIGYNAFWGCNNAIFYVANKDIKYVLSSSSNIDENKIIIKP